MVRWAIVVNESFLFVKVDKNDRDCNNSAMINDLFNHSCSDLKIQVSWNEQKYRDYRTTILAIVTIIIITNSANYYTTNMHRFLYNTFVKKQTNLT